MFNSHLWEMTDAKYYLYSATLSVYCPAECTNNNYYYYDTIYSFCIPLPKCITKYTSFNSKLTMTIIIYPFVYWDGASTSTNWVNVYVHNSGPVWYLAGLIYNGYFHSLLVSLCIKKTSQLSVILGCTSCPLRCIQTSGQLSYNKK